MKVNILYKGKKVCYSQSGSGKTIVLLHGYLESIDIWQEFQLELSKSFHVICIDLPGHGLSEPISEKQSVFDMASAVEAVLSFLRVKSCYMIGHSMGGYITLAFASGYSKYLSGFCLFHSTPFADSAEKINNRNREIELIKQGKKELIYSVNIPNEYADINHALFAKQILNGINIAKNTPDNGIISCLEAMKTRPDFSKLLKETNLPFLLILGRLDNYINIEKVGMNIPIPVKGKRIILEKSGHIGFIEEKALSLNIIKEFINE